MKKLIALLLFIVLFFFGCSNYEPYSYKYAPIAATLQSERNALLQQARKIAKDSEDCQKREFEFCLDLTDEQLKLHEKLMSLLHTAFQTGDTNNAAIIISARALQNSLPEEKWQVFAALLVERGEISQRAQDIVVRDQKLLKHRQTVKNTEYKQQQSQMSWQNFWQNYSHQQQQLQQQKMYDAQYDYYTRPYKEGNVTYIPARR